MNNIKIKVYCKRCGNPIESYGCGEVGRVNAQACPTCRNRFYDMGIVKGKELALKEHIKVDTRKAFIKGHDAGFKEGRIDVLRNPYTLEEALAHNEGRNQGLKERKKYKKTKVRQLKEALKLACEAQRTHKIGGCLTAEERPCGLALCECLSIKYIGLRCVEIIMKRFMKEASDA